MKKIVLIFVALIGFYAQAQEINWMSFNEAVSAQKKVKKPIFMDVYTYWCGPCKMLDKNTFSNNEIIEYINKNYYAVKFNAEGEEQINFKGKKFSNPNFDANRKGRNATHEFTHFLQIKGYPSMIIIDENGTISKTIVGYRSPEKLITEL